MPSPLTILLGQFKPSVFHEITIAIELQAWLRALGITAKNPTSKGRMPIEVRHPSEHVKLATTNAVITNWHRDGLGNYESYLPSGGKTLTTGDVDLDSERLLTPSILWLILWSNGTPTELMDKDRNRIYFEPYDVVAVNNHEVYHRCPPNEDGRWFVRLADPILPVSML